MAKIIGLFPLTGNGGIASWTKIFSKTFPDNEFQFTFVNVSHEVPNNEKNKSSLLFRTFWGLIALSRILRELKETLKNDKYEILHTTTSGNIGSYRDYRVAKLCKEYGIKCIMHCRYGCISEDYQSKNVIGWLLRKSMKLYDQIWVLDSRSFNYLKSVDDVKDRVFLTPNSIEVNEGIDDSPKDYKRIAFVGNLVPTKGLFELTRAALRCDVRLDIIGPGTDDVNKQLIGIAGNQLNERIFIHGRLANADAVKFMHDVDIIALPTYFPSEAFPISILEAMSLTKMVISCPRAAVQDMLTDIDGELCGMLVAPRSDDAIVDAINWCQSHKKESDQMCMKAYEKVKKCYSKEVVYDLYRSLYRKLV